MLSALSFEEVLYIALALALGGFTKGLTGLGLPLVTVPVLAGIVGVEHAVLVMIVPSLVLNVYPAWIHRESRSDLPELPRLLLAGLPGAVLGAFVLEYAGERVLATGLAIWIVGYVVLRLLHPDFSLSRTARLRIAPGVGAAAGALQAATGISAPIVAPYMDALRLEPGAYVFAVCTCFGAFAAAQLAAVAGYGLLSLDLLGQGVLAIVPAIGFIPVGIWARRFISRRAFELSIRGLLVIMAARLVYGAWFGAGA